MTSTQTAGPAAPVTFHRDYGAGLYFSEGEL